MSKRSKHPISIIEETLKYAERMGWKVKKTKKGHAWGRIFCPGGKRGDCIISIWSTPRIPESHVKRIRKRIKSCEHKK